MSDQKKPESASEAFARLTEQNDRIEAKLDRLLAHLGANQPAQGSNGGGGGVATVAQIRGDKGDPKIGKAPKNWHGPSFDGCVASECTPEYLDFHADFLDWKADNPRPGKEQYAKYDRADAARCRRWAMGVSRAPPTVRRFCMPRRKVPRAAGFPG